MLNRGRIEDDTPAAGGPRCGADRRGDGPPWLPNGSPWPPGWVEEPGTDRGGGRHGDWVYRAYLDVRRDYRCAQCGNRSTGTRVVRAHGAGRRPRRISDELAEIWDRQPGESSRGYGLFVHYRDLGPLERSYARVARDLERKVSGIEAIAPRNDWLARAAAWDAENERIKRASQIKDLERMARRQVLAGQLFQSRAVKRFQAMTDADIAKMTIWEAIRLYETGFRLERFGLGDPERLDPVPPRSGDDRATRSDIPIAEILRRNPSRVGPVVEVLAQLVELLPGLAGDDEAPWDGDEDDLDDLLNEAG